MYNRAIYIFGLCLQLQQVGIGAFCRYYANENMMQIDVYEKGWRHDADADKSISLSLRNENDLIKSLKCADYLLDLLTAKQTTPIEGGV